MKNLQGFISYNENFNYENKQEIIDAIIMQKNENKSEFLNRALTGLRFFKIENYFNHLK